MNSAIPVNPSIKASVSQNVVNVNYSDSYSNAVSLQASITNINIMKDFIKSDRYSIVLAGNIYTLPDTMLYIVIPFTFTASNNETMNSISIQQIVEAASSQIIDHKAVTILKSTLLTNNLITSGANYYYTQSNTFKNNVKYNKSFIIYKDEIGMISNSFKKLRSLIDTSIQNTLVYNEDNVFSNVFTPFLQSTPTSSEIMIDCSPVEITTHGENVMFSTKDSIFGNFSNDTTNNTVLNFIKYFIMFIIFIAVFVMGLKLIVDGFAQPKLFEDGDK
jgi:hypothetical protein